MPTVLTIAGSDPSGGAGIQADLRTFEAFNIQGLSAITAVTAQTENVFFSVNPVAADILTQQLSSAASQSNIDVVKIGMIGSGGNVRAIILFLNSTRTEHIIIDPVFTSSSGMPLFEPHAMKAFKDELLPLATVITPNLDEASILSGRRIWNLGTMKEAAREIYDETWQFRKNKARPLAILVKGGHLPGDSIDVLYDGADFKEFHAKRINAKRHGTGCVLSSAIAANLAKGVTLQSAIKTAKEFVENYISSFL
ncbi:MAG: bifunctional hydroxymethylpyrimidine kinase/phosphomethylpyrimidine kinase [Deltaproteobacteria bacterium RIFCSPLOWO2_02_FULL_47_10]|nr:MAG: bifunctional hydroxymethylpyrimidine kinase/phosphomethylpyrimidine kinase [Deltaproteobacteria bacterium RIFCSPLOWO2_02_FULL_47_10]